MTQRRQSDLCKAYRNLLTLKENEIYGKDYKLKTNMMVYRRRGNALRKMMQKNSSKTKNINSLQALQ